MSVTNYSVEGTVPRGSVVTRKDGSKYTRGRSNNTSSDTEAAKQRQCVREELKGESFNSQAEVNQALKEAAENC